MIRHTKLFTGLFDYGRYLHVVWLYETREQVMGSLMVEGPREHSPEPAVSGIVLSRGYLQFGPWLGESE